MTRDDLIRRIADTEDNFVERKSPGANKQEFRKTIVAFANSVPEGRSAVMFVGVKDDGEIAGCPNADQLQKKIRDICEKDCFPTVAFSSEVFLVEGKLIVSVVVPFSAKRPHFAGPAYIRKGSESVVASQEMLDELIYSRNSKVAAILRLRNQVISVSSVQHRLGKIGRVSDSNYVEHAECVVLDCTPHTVRLQRIGLGEYVSEPLDRVQISRDEVRHRPALVISGW